MHPSPAISSSDPGLNLKRPLLDPDSEAPEKPSKISRSSTPESKEDDDEASSAASSVTMSQNPSRIQRYLIAVEYIGTRFSGSQQQPNCRTVAGTLEEAFQKFVGKPVSVACSSRTDAGVHALSNAFHVDVERTSKRKPGEVLPPHEPGVVRRAVNHFLQKEGDIMLTDVRCIPSNFHARFKALERIYFYRLLSGPEPLSTFEKERAWHIPEELDLIAMKKACGVLVGHHDFSSFRASGCQSASPIKTLDELHICEVVPSLYFPSDVERRERSSESSMGCSVASDMCIGNYSTKNSHEFGQRRRHRCFVITARAQSFLYHQVRLLVGVLKSVGTGELTTSDVERILNAKTVTAASPKAPACGLYLGNVKYELP